MADQKEAPGEDNAEGPVFPNEETSTKTCFNSNVSVEADAVKVREFLIAMGGPWHICPAIRWAGWTFTDLDEAVAAALRANKRGCVYFLANTPRRGRLNGRTRRKSDIFRANAVFLDVDDPNPDIVHEFDRLGWPPTYVAFTGGGWQAMWRLSEPTTPKDGEAIAVWLQSEFEDLSPDSTHSCEHVFRLPGTRNRKAERHDRLCTLAVTNWDATLPLEEAGRLQPQPRRRAAQVDLSPMELDEDDLWAMLPPWALRLVNDPTSASGEHFPSRNEHEFAFVGGCLRDDVPADVIASVLLLPAGIGDTHRVSHRAHWAKVKGVFVPRRNPLAHARRQIGAHPDFGGGDE